MIPRARLDVAWADLAFAGVSCLLPARRERLEREVASAFPTPDHALPFLSARSGFDVLLQALDLPEGSEVLLSAITIPDMVRIVREHGLVPVPVDIDPPSLAPCTEALEAAWSPKSRVLVVAHLFGAESPLDEAREFARQRGLTFVEDGAQSFIPGHFLGRDDSDIRMLSFGPIKTSTALGTGVLLVKDAELRRAMDAIRLNQPVRSTLSFARRVTWYVVLKAVALKGVFGLFRAMCTLAGRSFDTVLQRASRGTPGGTPLHQIRRRPAGAQLGLLARRLGRPNPRIDARRRSGALLASMLPESRLPGGSAPRSSFWVFPVLADHPDRLALHLRDEGFDCTRGASSLRAVPVPPERAEVRADQAEHLANRLLFVPAYPEIDPRELTRLGTLLLQWFAGEERAAEPSRLHHPSGLEH